MVVPGPGVESERQGLAYATASETPGLSCSCDLLCGLQQHWMLNPLSEARDRTGILTDKDYVSFLTH